MKLYLLKIRLLLKIRSSLNGSTYACTAFITSKSLYSHFTESNPAKQLHSAGGRGNEKSREHKHREQGSSQGWLPLRVSAAAAVTEWVLLIVNPGVTCAKVWY